MTTHRSHRWYWVLLGVFVALGLPGACQKDKPMEPEPASDLRLARVEADRTELGPGDSTVVRAWVVRGGSPGTPVPGAAVAFREMPDRGSGTFSKTEAVTDLLGWATTTFHPVVGLTGLVTIKVQVGTSIQYVLLQVLQGTQEGLSMDLSTSEGRTSLPADATTELEVTVRAYTGEPSAPVAGLPLVLTAGDGFQDKNGNGVYDAGDQLIPGRDRNRNGVWDPEGSLPERVQTDDQGIATFRYRAGRSVGPVYVRVSGGGTSRELIVQQHSLELAVTVRTGARELLANGVAETDVEVEVSDWSADPISGVVVKLTAGEPFTDANGDGFYSVGESFVDTNDNGEWDAMGSMPAAATTDFGGVARARYRSGLASGDVTLRATTSNGFGQAVVRLVAVPPAARLELRLERTTLHADEFSRCGGSVDVRDAADLPLAGKAVSLAAGERFEDADGDGRFTAGTDRLLDDLDRNGIWSPIGTIEPRSVTAADGKASFTYTSGAIVGQVWIRAAVDGHSVEAPIVLSTPPPVASLRVTPAYERMTVAGGGGATRNVLTAECLRATGDPVPAGTPVTFRIMTGPGGGERLEASIGGLVETSTDGAGRAQATLLSGTRSGWVQVRASTGSFYEDAGIYIDPGPVATVSCYADSVSLVLGSQSLVSAWLYDAEHNPVRDGTQVRFAADEGLIVPANGGLTTDGKAEAIYTSVPPRPDDDGRAVITASADGENDGVVECRSTILVTAPAGEICRLQAVSLLGEIGVRGTGAVEQAGVYARAFDCQEDPARAGLRVLFRILSGPDGGEYLCGTCECDTASGWTDELGIARATLSSGTKSGTVLVQAEVPGDPGISAHTPVAIAAGPPHYISVGVQDCNVLAHGYVNELNPVVALVYDVYRNPVRDGTAVYFTTDHGMIEGDDGAGLGSDLTFRGQAEATWHSDGTGGIVNVIASTYGERLVDAVTFFIGSGDPYSATFLVPPSSPIALDADGRSTALMRVQVLDVNGLYVLPADVRFRAIYGNVPSSARTEDGCNASYAEAEYTAPTLERDESYSVPDDGIGALDLVTAGGGFGPLGDEFQVQLRTGNASASRSAIDLENLPPGAQSFFTVAVKDRWGNPLGGHQLSLAATQGVITPSGLTDSYGIAGGLSFVAPDTTATVYVEVRDLDPNRGGNMILRKTISISQ